MTTLAMRTSACTIAFAAVLLLACSGQVMAAPGDTSPDGLWTEIDPSTIVGPPFRLPQKFKAYRLDLEAMRRMLATAPLEDLRGGAATTRPVITLPLPDGTFAPTSVVESPTLGPVLASQFPTLKTYAVRGTADPGISGRLTSIPTEIQVLLLTAKGPVRITPLKTAAAMFYLSYFNEDRTDGAEDWIHPADEQIDPNPPGPALKAHVHKALHVGTRAATGSELRRYRLAVATTGEYYQARVGPGGALDVLATIVAEVNNANAVFEAEVAVRLRLDFAILNSDPDTDPYTAGATACGLRDENPAAINAVVNVADYDIGFVFGSGGGNGCAWYVLCQPDKARGAGLINTANVLPGGSTGLLAHEMGHQLGARHTWSGQAGGCTAIEFNQPSAFEPGSGTTIMSYRGNCGSDNVTTTPALPAGRYYHTRSFDEIVDNTTSGPGSTCGTVLATGNSTPVVNAGGDYTIPRDTPFTLIGSAIDPDGDPLTFAWEQFDVAANRRPIDTDTGEGPIFRSVPPTGSTSRTFPTLSDILNNTQTKGEILPTTDRTLNFRLTARDNRAGGGGVAYDGALITVNGDPFFITSPNGGEVFGAGCQMPVTWTVGGGSVAANVNLLFSEDGGNNFSSLLANQPNNGAANTVAPCTTTALARVKAEGAGNVFFDISDDNFSVVKHAPTVAVQATGGVVNNACQFTVNFTASVADDCATKAGDVTVQVIKQANNFTLGPVAFNAVQVDPMTVSVSGSVLVSDVVSSPAVVFIKVTGVDACGLSTSQQAQAAVSDVTPPTILASLEPNLLWPPNHKLTNIAAHVTVQDNCPNPSFVLTSIVSNEPDNGLGDGDTANDIQNAQLGTPDTSFSLRAERSGGGNGRTYTVTYTATDASNNQTQASPVVVVPKSQK